MEEKEQSTENWYEPSK